MKPPPRPDGNGGGVTWDKQVGRPLVNRPALAPQAPKQLLRKLEAARQRLDRQTKALEIIAGWRDELRNRISRSRLRFEVIGLSRRGATRRGRRGS